MKHTLDAQGQRVGRIASQAAALLIGKNLPSFQRNQAPEVQVEIINASKALIDTKKMKATTFARYSGYPGGLRHEGMTTIIAKKGYSEVFRQAVHGMLPTNKLRAIMIKHLTVTE